MTTETVETADGSLKLYRRGRKLIKVEYTPRDVIPLSEIDDLGYCDHCGTYVEIDHGQGVFYDLGENFLCNYSPSGQHEVSEMMS